MASKRLRDAHNAHVRATVALERASAATQIQQAAVQRAEAKLAELNQARIDAVNALETTALELQQAVAAEVTK